MYPITSGSKVGLLGNFQANTDNFVYCINSMAHRLELAIEKAMGRVKYYKNFEELINKFFQFNNLNNSKRKSHLKKLRG